ncbi:hypothetical protein AWV80_26935 [Cupriavidus sp. UYMU48A]|nr:hypothetical protein AWV80_26935 [Cupriavidus sp. UYMU48A]
MGMTQPSLYNAFGDKRSLFLKVLEYYLDNPLESAVRPTLAADFGGVRRQAQICHRPRIHRVLS